MRVEQTSIPGCYQLFPQVRKDNRGSFVKIFHQDIFAKHGLVTEFAEEYYSVSHKGVLRGLHFQTPPYEHFKLVYCLAGKVLDAIVDLRTGSPTYKQSAAFELSAQLGNMLYIAPGMAHGFYALTDEVIMQYKVTTVYAPEHDGGIRWDSVGINWPSAAPIISDRDRGFPALADFDSPFRFET
ncbi:MAG: dTDP-4-dehydrorhamnose 3,5-epimerase [Gallionella sp.]